MLNDVGVFSVRDEKFIRIACLSKERSYAVRNNGMVFSVFSSNDTVESITSAVFNLPERGFLQVMRFRWKEQESRFMAITFPFKDISEGYNPISALDLKNNVHRLIDDFNAFPNQAFEKILDYRSRCGLSGENLFKVGAENLVYSYVGGVSIDNDTVATNHTITGYKGFYRGGDVYGVAVDFTSFGDFENIPMPDGAYFSCTSVRSCGYDEAHEIRQNTMGSKVFSGHLKKIISDKDEITKLQPYGFTHTVILLDPSHKSLKKRVDKWCKDLMHEGVATTWPRLRLLDVLRSTLPGQGDMHPSCLYLDRESCTDILLKLNGV